MTFWSDAHQPPVRLRAEGARPASRRLNWRLLLLVALNTLSWIAVAAVVAAVL